MKLKLTLSVIFILLVLVPAGYALAETSQTSTPRQQQLDDWAKHFESGKTSSSSTTSSKTT